MEYRNICLIFVSDEAVTLTLKNIITMTTYSAKEVIGKGCEIKLNGVIYYCYNETSLMHFVKCNKNSERLSIKNRNNLLSLSSDQVKRFIDLGSIVVTIGNVPK